MRTKARSLLLLVGLLAVVLVRPVAADPPEHIDVDETFLDESLTAFCGFPVEQHVQGQLGIQQRGDTVATTGANFRRTFTNLDTGQSVELYISGLQEETFDPVKGLFRLSFSGRMAQIVVPGEGAVFVDAGRFVQTVLFDPETGEVISVEIIDRGRNEDVPLEVVLRSLLSAQGVRTIKLWNSENLRDVGVEKWSISSNSALGSSIFQAFNSAHALAVSVTMGGRVDGAKPKASPGPPG